MFIESLKDGRNVWLNGKRIDITEDTNFRGTLTTIESLFSQLTNPKLQPLIGYFDDDLQQWVHKAFYLPRNITELQERRTAFEAWAKDTNGMMSRLSDYARSRVAGWYANREAYRELDPHFPGKIEAYYHIAKRENRFIAIIQRDPQINRSANEYYNTKKLGLLRITKKTNEGVYINGAKMIGTSAPYAHDIIVYPLAPLDEAKKDLAHMLIVPANAKGLHMVCRESFAEASQVEYSLSAQYDEMDAVLIFDDVFVPWERVLLHDNPIALAQLKVDSISNSLAYHQAIVRLQTKLSFMAAVANAMAHVIGADGYLHVQEKLGELIIQIRTIEGLIIAAEQNGKLEKDIYIPDFNYIQTARVLGTKYYPNAVEIIQLIGAGGLIQLPSSMADLSGQISQLTQQYYKGKNATAEERTKLFKLAWDLIGSPFGSRHELYERFYSGDPMLQTADMWRKYDKKEWTRQLAPFWKNC
ncbi:4-hydroxyphenylacetate 3-hydroxylase N-terminal domain-containing protein [Cytobacillus sp. FSL W7-1323]|uniref:4-hydroxyphenylacetate 3-hydroxylase family protein n=1 Tax=unclassified Cytobacillus TaxID=2675268 RepID=UPI002B000770|nr:4-hydroxyphenylacetate 3-hydroxylase N-terminal domain-containing protein [Cytobacillus sp. OWB-43]MEA1851591.1 4-hydroxyphenylacetate 3-hydroxylase N-terminal domain-containing protein [Cytobacillus sp. OWB-43]